MPLENYLAFIIATIIMLLIPGPSVIMAVGQAIAYGRKAVMPTALGVVSGDFIAMSLSMLGVGTVLLASSMAFAVIKWVGVAYLIYLGVRTLMSAGTTSLANSTMRMAFLAAMPISMTSPIWANTLLV